MDEFENNTPLEPTNAERIDANLPGFDTGIIADASSEPAAEQRPARTPYTRRRPPRRTIEAIDDLADDDSTAVYTHESDIAVGGMVQDGSYRRARAEISQFQRNNRYGQYLEVPKGRRSIFAKQERKRRRQSALMAIIVIGLLLAVAYLIWTLMSKVSFGSLILGEWTRPLFAQVMPSGSAPRIALEQGLAIIGAV